MKQLMFILLTGIVFFSCKNENEEPAIHNPVQEKIVKELTTRVQQNPDSASLRMRLINALDSLHRYDEALVQTDSLIAKDSLNNGLWFAKAQLLESNKDTAEAIRSYRRALNIYPSVEAQLSLANLLAETKNAGALQLCQNVQNLKLGREADASCQFIAGVYYARTGNHPVAVQHFDRAINDNYTLMEAYMEKGFSYYDTKNYPAALKVFETAITVNNLYADAYYWKAKCNEAMGNKAEALDNYKRSLGLDRQLKEAAEAIKRLE